MSERYPAEQFGLDDDDGTIAENVAELTEAVVGRRIVRIEEQADIPEGQGSRYWGRSTGLLLELDNGRRVYLSDTDDCCAFTELEGVIKHLDQIDHVITGVGTTDGAERWHIFADAGDVLELQVAWSPGNPRVMASRKPWAMKARAR